MASGSGSVAWKHGWSADNTSVITAIVLHDPLDEETWLKCVDVWASSALQPYVERMLMKWIEASNYLLIQVSSVKSLCCLMS